MTRNAGDSSRPAGRLALKDALIERDTSKGDSDKVGKPILIPVEKEWRPSDEVRS